MIYILVKGTTDGLFTAVLSATDILNQTAEILVSITIYNWASKDCIMWTGVYQEDWIQWADRYFLDNQEKTWFPKLSYL